MKDKTGRELSQDEIMKKGAYRVETILQEFIVYILHIVGYIPSHLIRKAFYMLAGIKMGEGSTIHMGARFYIPSNIMIGKDTIIGEGVVLDGRDKLTIGDHVDIATDVMIYNAQHNIHSEKFATVEDTQRAPVVIGDYVFIGPRAVILPGVTIGKGVIIGAGAVVTRDIEPFMVAGGVPAKVIGERKLKDPSYTLGRPALFR